MGHTQVLCDFFLECWASQEEIGRGYKFCLDLVELNEAILRKTLPYQTKTKAKLSSPNLLHDKTLCRKSKISANQSPGKKIKFKVNQTIGNK